MLLSKCAICEFGCPYWMKKFCEIDKIVKSNFSMKQFLASEMNHAVWMNSIPCYILHKAEFILMKLPMLTSHIKKSNHLMNLDSKD